MKIRIRQMHGGFTLIEMIMVIVITSVVASMAAVFMRVPVDAYMATSRRAELTDAADMALRRMARDIRLSLPNSLRITSNGNGNGNFLELLLTNAGGRYLDVDDGTAGNILDFSDPADLSFEYVGPAIAIANGNALVVNNWGPGSSLDAYTGVNVATVANVAGTTITMTSNPFANIGPAARSAGQRFYIVTTPVTYGCVNGNLIRYSGYGISAAQATPPAGGSADLVASGVNCTFSYGQANQGARLVGMNLTVTREGETVTLFHQVHVSNMP